MKSPRNRIDAQAVLDAIPSLVFVKDPDGHFVIVNQAFADFFGKSKDEIHGLSDTDFKHSTEQLGYFQEMDRRVLENGEPIVMPLEFATDANGKPVPLTTHKVPCGENVLGISTLIGISSGVGGLFSEMLDNCPQGIYVKDKDRRYILVNRELVKLLGRGSSGDLLGRTLEDTGHEYAEKAREEDMQVLQVGVPVIGRCRVIANRTTGEFRTLQTNKHPVRDSAGRVVGLMGFVEDVSRMQKLQNHLVLRDFTAGLAHQLKNRLFTFETTFCTLAAVLEQERRPDVLEAMDVMESTIRELKAFMATIGTRIKMQAAEVKVTSASDAARRALRKVHTTCNLLSGITDDLWVLADPEGLEEAVVELLVNALKHIEDRRERDGESFVGNVLVKVEAAIGRIQGRENEVVRVTVKDNGYGIEPERKTLIFHDMFTTTATGWGFGLGAVWHTIVERSGGNLFEDGTFGDGARFVIELKKASPPTVT